VIVSCVIVYLFLNIIGPRRLTLVPSVCRVMYTYMTISVKAPKRAHSLTELESAICTLGRYRR